MRGGLNIAAKTRKLDVDNRLPLKLYYRTADNLLKQASIYREERNIIDLYILLLRFSRYVLCSTELVLSTVLKLGFSRIMEPPCTVFFSIENRLCL
jgi:hypothetical protein